MEVEVTPSHHVAHHIFTLLRLLFKPNTELMIQPAIFKGFRVMLHLPLCRNVPRRGELLGLELVVSLSKCKWANQAGFSWKRCEAKEVGTIGVTERKKSSSRSSVGVNEKQKASRGVSERKRSSSGSSGEVREEKRASREVSERKKPSSKSPVGVTEGKKRSNSSAGKNRDPPPSKFEADVSTHRAVVVVRLLRIEYGGAFSDVISGDGDASWEREMDYVEHTLGFRTPALKPAGMKLVTEEVAGIVRWKRYLDYVIYTLFDKDAQDFERMEPSLRQILRVGAYELLKLEMPPYAVVNEAVKLASAALRPGAGNLVNGLLRNLTSHQKKNTVPVPQVAGDERSQARALATIHSHPVWLVRRWIDRYGREEAIKLIEWNNARPTYALRANHARGTSQDDLIHELETLEVPCVRSPYLQDFVRLTTGMQDVLRAGLVQEGKCTVQDESAGIVVSLLDPQPGDVVIDCCAAPGGKSLYIASRLKGEGKVLAVDINKARLRVLKEAAKKAGVADLITVHNVDTREMIRGSGAALADKVLLDAPCSGLGVLSKRADLRWRRTLENMKELTELQDQLLDGAAQMVRPGGVLVYSTCSIEPEENSLRVSNFLSQNQKFTLESADGYVPEEMVSSEGYFHSLPHKNGIDGAFAARLRRTI